MNHPIYLHDVEPKSLIPNAFITLHEYLYKQEAMQSLRDMLYQLAETSKSEDALVNQVLDSLTIDISNFFTEEANKVTSIKHFISYQGFCIKMKFLIAQVSNQRLKNNLLAIFSTVEQDITLKNDYDRYKKLIDDLHTTLNHYYTQVKTLNIPNKWDNFAEILVVLHYLNSSENPFARKNSVAEDANKLHADALADFKDFCSDDFAKNYQFSQEELEQFFKEVWCFCAEILKSLGENLQEIEPEKLFEAIIGQYQSPVIKAGFFSASAVNTSTTSTALAPISAPSETLPISTKSTALVLESAEASPLTSADSTALVLTPAATLFTSSKKPSGTVVAVKSTAKSQQPPAQPPACMLS